MQDTCWLAAAALLQAVREAGLVDVKPRVERFEGHDEVHRSDIARDLVGEINETISRQAGERCDQ